MTINVTDQLVNQRSRQYINKTFEDFRNDLFQYARSNFPNQIQDFSESSLGGMLLDFAAIVGDSLSFYTEQQFSELNYETAVNRQNIISHLRRAGIKGGNASPSSVYVTFYIEVDIDETADINSLQPDVTNLPIIKKGTRLLSNSNISFILSEDVDFNLDYTKTVSEVDDDGLPLKLVLEKKGVCTSGNISTESISFSQDDSNLFLSYQLNNSNVQKIIKVVDNDLNEYYEVDFLSQNTVYKKVENAKESFIYPTVTPFRFIVENNYINNTSLMRFGNGSGKKLEANLLVNPEDLTIPLKDRDYDLSVSLDPSDLVKTNSLGVSPAGKNLEITYIHGGGFNHNVSAESIETISDVVIVFPNINCKTKSVYKMVRQISAPTGNTYLNKLSGKKFINTIIKDKNDLQKIVEKKYTKIFHLIKFIKSQESCIFSRMSGSGSACYGVFKSKNRAKLAIKNLKRKYPKYWCVITKTI